MRGCPIPCSDEGGDMWLYRDADGIDAIVCADSLESAHEAVMNLLPAINEDEVPEAYGFYGKTGARNFRNAVDAGDELELVDGYVYQPSPSGTGIVGVSVNGENLFLLTPKIILDLDIILETSTW